MVYGIIFWWFWFWKLLNVGYTKLSSQVHFPSKIINRMISQKHFSSQKYNNFQKSIYFHNPKIKAIKVVLYQVKQKRLKNKRKQDCFSKLVMGTCQKLNDEKNWFLPLVFVKSWLKLELVCYILLIFLCKKNILFDYLWWEINFNLS